MSKYRSTKQITKIIIHCAATPNGRPDTAQDIDNWHKARGFKRSFLLSLMRRPWLRHIGYHYVIKIDGEIQAGRALTETGSHARGHNTSSVGICLIGNDKFTKAQWLSLRYQVRMLKTLFPEADIIGHNQVNAHKACPRFNVRQWLDTGMKSPQRHIINTGSKA